MIVDELILKLQADLADVKKGLAQVKVDAEKTGKEAGANMGKAAGTSFGDVFQAVAGAAVLNAVNSFYGKAAQAFNKFEAAFLRVDSIAKGFGRSVDTARKQVEQLADKGFLNLNQAASSYADAIALGFDEKQARKFIDSLSDIAAFQNTIGNGAEAVQSGLAGLLSNSAEKVENIGVPVKVLNMQYNENIKTMGKAAALQKFYNGILKESEKFTGDAARAVDTLQGAQNKANAATDKAMVAIGKGLEPTLKKLYNTVEDLALGFAKWFNSLDSTTKTVALMVPVIAALSVAFGTLLPILKAISLSNPFGWVAAAITGVGALIVLVRQLNADSNPEIIAKKYHETAKAYKETADRAKELQAINKRTADQEKELATIKDNLRAKAKALGVNYDELAKSAKNAADMTQMLTNVERERAADKLRANLRDIASRRAGISQGARLGNEAQNQFVELAAEYTGGVSRSKANKILDEQERQNIQGLVDIYQTASADGTKAVQAAAAAAGKATEARFIESQQKLKEIETNRVFTIQKLGKKLKDEDAEEERKRRIAAANQDALYQRQTVLASLNQTLAEYNENKREADLLTLQEQTRNAKRASEEKLSYELALAGKNEALIQDAKKRNVQRLAEIQKSNAIKQGVIEAEAMARTAQAAQASVSGFSQIANAKDIGGALSGFGGLSKGLSGLSPSLKALGPLGDMFGAFGGIASTLSGLFGKSDEERAREAAEAQRVREEQLKILELQANYQKNMLALQEAAAKLPFENLQRQLRLIDIESQQDILRGGDATAIETARLQRRQTAIQGTLTSQSSAISGGQLFGGTGSSPEQLIGFLSERGAQSLAVQQFVAGFNSISSDIANPAVGDAQISALYSYRGKVPDALLSILDDYNAKREALKSQFNAALQNMGSYGTLNAQDLETVNRIANTTAPASLAAAIGAVNTIGSEISADTGIAENLLSTLEQSLANQKQIQDNTKKTADNTAKALELRPDRERSFIDVGLGFIQSLGQRISPSAIGIAQGIARQNLTLPTSIGTATATSSLARTLQERMADAMEIQVAQGERANQLLDGILRATIELYRVMDGNPGTVSTFDDAAATAYLADRKRRAY